ncbi:hypothetical protein A2U01_0082974, partial [Trifolium medium]|nr:hypothetical protein [Trifolium medium]
NSSVKAFTIRLVGTAKITDEFDGG